MNIGGVTRAFSSCILTAFLVLCSVSMNVSAADGRRIALVVGNGAYGNLPKLANPPRDAALIAAKLRSVGFEVDLATDDDQSGLEQRVRAFGLRARGASAALFYYAGHGLQAGGSNYLLPVDAKLRKLADLRSQSLPLSSVSDALDFADAKISLIILDACRDNPLTRSMVMKNGTRSVKTTRGLASMQRASGRLIAYSTAPGAVAYDGGSSTQNSPFTQAVADWIEEPGLEIANMFQRVREQVITATDGKQIPWIEEAILGDFYFLPTSLDPEPTIALPIPEPVTPAPTLTPMPLPTLTPAPAPAPTVTEDPELEKPSLPVEPPASDQIETAWSKTTELGTRDAYIAFLEQYPDSTFAQQAVAELLDFASSALPTAAPAPASPEPSSALAPAPAPAPAPIVTEDPELEKPLPPADTEADDPIEAAWSKTTALDTRDAYIEFLDQYPDSIFAQQAVAKLLQFASPAAPAAAASSQIPAPSSKAAAGPTELE